MLSAPCEQEAEYVVEQVVIQAADQVGAGEIWDVNN